MTKMLNEQSKRSINQSVMSSRVNELEGYA